MQTSELRNKFLFFVIFAGVVTLLLIILPFIELLPLKDYISGFIGTTDGRMGATRLVASRG